MKWTLVKPENWYIAFWCLFQATFWGIAWWLGPIVIAKGIVLSRDVQ